MNVPLITAEWKREVDEAVEACIAADDMPGARRALLPLTRRMVQVGSAQPEMLEGIALARLMVGDGEGALDPMSYLRTRLAELEEQVILDGPE